MKETKLLCGLLAMATLLIFVGALFCFRSGAFIPPEEPVPMLQLMSRTVKFPPRFARSAGQGDLYSQEANAHPLKKFDEQPSGQPHLSIEALLQDFYSRQPRRSATLTGSTATSVESELTEVLYTILKGEESVDTFTALLRSADGEERLLIMRALRTASGLPWGRRSDGFPALVNLWSQLNKADLELVLEAAVEALVCDTQDGSHTQIPFLLLTMGERARPAIPHLAWASNSHPSAHMRNRIMLMTWLLATDESVSRDVILRRLLDPVASMRVRALQTLVGRSLSTFTGTGLPSEEEMLEVYEQDRKRLGPTGGAV